MVDDWDPDWLTAGSDSSPETASADEELKLLFLACHPALSESERMMLVLRTVGGLNAKEIARAFLSTEAAVAQKLVRAKQRIRESHLGFELPVDSALVDRREHVLHALYLIFNEGYSPTEGSGAPNVELCETAISLLERLLATSVGNVPESHALFALFCFHRARVETRIDDAGVFVPLEFQDRSRWSRDWIAAGVRELPLAAVSRRLSSYHLEAGIAAEHTLAPAFELVNWNTLLDLYDTLYKLRPSLSVEVSLSLALGKARGCSLGLNRLERIEGAESYGPYWTAKAWLQDQLHMSSLDSYVRALELVKNEAERKFLERKLSQSC
jgi:RNA polymerase sigma-70 factor (ECF subfamily)